MAVSDAAWSEFSPKDFSAEQWQRACLVDTGEGAPESKDRYKLPVREPSGELNRNAVHAAAGRIHELQGISSEKKSGAARKLVGLYRQMGENAPEALLNLANEEGERSAPPVELLYISNFRSYETKGSPIEVRSAETRTIGGYGAVFGKRSVNLGGFHEMLDPQLFNKSRADGWPGVICRFNHEDNFLLGTTRSGTLRIAVDKVGLPYEVDLPQCRSDVYEMTQRGDLAHSSFAFRAYDEDWAVDDTGYPIRTVTSAKLLDVSPVTNPAYPDATVGLRSLARHVGAPYEDVVERSHSDELRGFFIRTDVDGGAVKKAPKSGPAALMEILSKRPDDPIGV